MRFYGAQKGKKSFSKRRAFRRRGVSKFNYTAKRGNVLSIAKKALALAKQTANASTETKYLATTKDQDLVNLAQAFCNGTAMYEALINAAHTPLYNCGYLNGNKSYCKYIKGYYEIHADNVNAEEETVNYTVMVVKFKSDIDISSSANLSEYFFKSQGQVWADPRNVKVLYCRRHITSGFGNADSPSGNPWVKGQYFIPVRKMIRWTGQNDAGVRTTGVPMSFQDQHWLLVWTDNASTDLESPRINSTLVACYRDDDIQG